MGSIFFFFIIILFLCADLLDVCIYIFFFLFAKLLQDFKMIMVNQTVSRWGIYADFPGYFLIISSISPIKTVPNLCEHSSLLYFFFTCFLFSAKRSIRSSITSIIQPYEESIIFHMGNTRLVTYKRFLYKTINTVQLIPADFQRAREYFKLTRPSISYWVNFIKKAIEWLGVYVFLYGVSA